MHASESRTPPSEGFRSEDGHVESTMEVGSDIFARFPEMYRLPGDPQLTLKDRERFLKSPETVSVDPKDIQKGMADKEDYELRARALGLTSLLSGGDQAEFLQIGLHDPEYLVQERVAEVVLETLPMIPSTLFLEVLKSLSVANKLGMLSRVSQEYVQSSVEILHHVTDEIKEKMIDPVYFVRRDANKCFFLIPESLRAEVLISSFKNTKGDIHRSLSQLVSFVPVADQESVREVILELIHGAFQKKDNTYQERLLGIMMISEAPENMRAQLIRKSLDLDDSKSREVAFNQVPSVPSQEKKGLVKQGLADAHGFLSLRAVELSLLLSPEEQASLQGEIEKVILLRLQDTSSTIYHRALNSIGRLPESKLLEVMRQQLEDEDPDVRIRVLELFYHLPSEQQKPLASRMLSALEDGMREQEDQDVPTKASKLLSLFSEEERSRLLHLNPVFLKKLQDLATGSPLYKGYPEPFFRKTFRKTGSGTTLFDRVPGQPDHTFRERLIERHIEVLPYEAWRKIYEAASFWKEHGFDYVPVEPIVQASFDASTLRMDVFTRVLKGPSFGKWESQTDLYEDEINNQIEVIKSALKEFDLEHGHLHHGNFVLLFERDVKGEVVLEKLPRVYVIDFDQASSSSSQDRSGISI